MSSLARVVYFILEYNNWRIVATLKSAYVLRGYSLLKKFKTVKHLLKINPWCSNIKCGTEEISLKNIILLTFVKNKKRYTQSSKIWAIKRVNKKVKLKRVWKYGACKTLIKSYGVFRMALITAKT